MARFGWPSLLLSTAGGGYVASQSSDKGISDFVLGGIARQLGRDPPTFSGRSGGGELQVLQGEVDRLHRLLSDVVRGNNGRPAIVQIGGRSGWTALIYPAAAGGLVLYLYCRVTGNSFLDLFYVSRSSLANFRDTVMEGFTKVWDEMRKQKDEFVNRISAVTRKQEQLMDNQNSMMDNQTQMDDRLRRVADHVDDIRTTTNDITTRVELLDNKMAEVAGGVQSANYGIMLLCQAVHDVTHRIGMHNNRSSQALKSYLHAPPVQGGATPQQLTGTSGLRGLIMEGSGADGFGDGQSGPTLAALPAGSSNSSIGGSRDGSPVPAGMVRSTIITDITSSAGRPAGLSASLISDAKVESISSVKLDSQSSGRFVGF